MGENYFLREGERVYIQGPKIHGRNGELLPAAPWLVSYGYQYAENNAEIMPFTFSSKLRQQISLPVFSKECFTIKEMPKDAIIEDDTPVIRIWNKNGLEDGYGMNFIGVDENNQSMGGINISIFPFDDIRFMKERCENYGEDGMFVCPLSKSYVAGLEGEFIYPQEEQQYVDALEF